MRSFFYAPVPGVNCDNQNTIPKSVTIIIGFNNAVLIKFFKFSLFNFKPAIIIKQNEYKNILYEMVQILAHKTALGYTELIIGNPKKVN
ncbi:hypothetical protein [Mycoplasmopsis cynos]|uniref:hypothetical protein n=1 Tax=Mycoplasmopsis cynos TaxID=171284 RepID=UPI0030CF5663